MRRKWVIATAIVFTCGLGLLAIHKLLIGRHMTTDWVDWSRLHYSKVEQYRSFLQARNVGEVIPIQQLLISARNPATCPDMRYEVPPQETWENIVPTLRLIQFLADKGLLKLRAATSGYRTAGSNACSGGAKNSVHRDNNAIDLEIENTSNAIQELCEFWRAQGGQFRFGLGFYDIKSIHIDTSGHRTWGYDYTYKTSMCYAK